MEIRVGRCLTVVLLSLSTSALAGSPAVKVTTLASELDGAVGGVAVDALGYVYVADFGENVWKIDPFGKVEILADSLYGTSGNAVDLDVLYTKDYLIPWNIRFQFNTPPKSSLRKIAFPTL